MSYPTEHPPVPPQNGLTPQGSGSGTNQQSYSAAGTSTAASSPKGRKKLTLMISGIIGLIFVIAGIAFAMNFFRTPASPAEGLPANANMVLRIELNPNDAKKFEIYQFLTKFPTAKEKLSQDSFTADPLKAIWESVLGPQTNIDYDAEIKSWLGDSVGIAAVVKNGVPKPIISFHTKDAAKAKSFFDTKVAGNVRDLSATVSGNFLVLTESGDTSLVDEIKKNPLSKSSTYTQDMAHLTDPGLLSFWADEEFLKAATRTASSSTIAIEGRVAASLSVTADAAQFNSWASSGDSISSGDVREVASGLPASSDLVIAGSLDREFIKSFVAGLKSSMASSYSDFEEVLGGDVEAALSTMLGSQTAFVAEVKSFFGSAGPDSVNAALVTKSDDPSKQESLWKDMIRALSGPPVFFQAENGTSVVALQPSYGAAFSGAADKLSSKDSFKSVIDTSKPIVGLVYYDPKETLEQVRSELPQEYISDLKAVSGIGLTVAKADDKSVNMVLKVSVKG